MLATTAN